MPTQPDMLNSTDFPRAPGTPQSNGLPQPRPAQPAFPNPPGLATGVPGRPPATPSPVAGSNLPYPQPPVSSTAPQRGSQFPLPPGVTPLAQPMQQRPQPIQRNPVAQAPAQINPQTQPQPVQPPAQPVRTPTPNESAQLPPGAQVTTPVGTYTQDGTGSGAVALSPEGQQKYKESVVKLRKQMGPTPKAMSLPGAPEMPAQPGSHNYNPWTGQFTRG